MGQAQGSSCVQEGQLCYGFTVLVLSLQPDHFSDLYSFPSSPWRCCRPKQGSRAWLGVELGPAPGSVHTRHSPHGAPLCSRAHGPFTPGLTIGPSLSLQCSHAQLQRGRELFCVTESRAARTVPGASQQHLGSSGWPHTAKLLCQPSSHTQPLTFNNSHVAVLCSNFRIDS